jgi:hypothetical protein
MKRHASVAGALTLVTAVALADTLPVRYPEGILHGFLTLSTLDGKRVANGELLQVARGDRVTSRTVFLFGDGSRQDETAVFTQKGRFQLVSYRLVQKGPTFPTPLDMTLDVASGRCVVHALEKDGKQSIWDEQLDLTPDVANGMILVLLKNVPSDMARMELPMVLATPKPRLVKLAITPAGEEAFRVGGASHKAVRYQVHIDLGGIVEILADLAGKAPADTHVWIERGDVPAFVKSEGPMAIGAPEWRIELASTKFGAPQ